MNIWIAAAAAAMIVPASAAPAVSAPTSGTITVQMGAAGHGWLTTQRRPDGSYAAAIDIRDLDLTTPAGWRAVNLRAANGAAIVCDLAQEEPRIPGFANPGQRACRAETGEQIAAQLQRARIGAADGHPVVRLGFAGS